jgi:amidophosphoribosyltransferase
VDTPQREKLLAATMSEEEMREHLGVASLKFISLNGLYRACGIIDGRNDAEPQFCDACFSGEYPVIPADQINKGFRLKAAE